VVLFP
jgi:hypothetical protein